MSPQSMQGHQHGKWPWKKHKHEFTIAISPQIVAELTSAKNYNYNCINNSHAKYLRNDFGAHATVKRHWSQTHTKRHVHSGKFRRKPMDNQTRCWSGLHSQKLQTQNPLMFTTTENNSDGLISNYSYTETGLSNYFPVQFQKYGHFKLSVPKTDPK